MQHNPVPVTKVQLGQL